MATTTHAERARLAHRALRLRENGVDSESKLLQIAKRAAPQTDEHGALNAPGHPLGRIALGLADALDKSAPGPTDRALVEKLMSRKDLDSIYKEWDDAVTANLEETLEDKDLKSWRDSVARDQKEFDEKVARMQESGDFNVHPYFGHLRHTDGAANALFDLGREGFLAGEIDWDTAVIKLALIDSADYTVNLATHKFMSSVTAAGIEETSPALATKTVAAGVADADDTSFTAAAGDPCEAIIIYQSSAVTGGADVANTAQRLIAYIDTASGLPVTLNGGNVNVVFDSGSNRIFKL